MNNHSSEHPKSAPDSGSGAADYQVIARRFRPRTFSDVVGQEAVAEALRQSILQNRLAHAYLFCGPRGVGKTSMARIFAAALQCPNSSDAAPCANCSTCERIFRGEDSDVTEMDGASHRGIDDIRGLIEHVQYAPTQGSYRVFILDEVHMLTREAFNALLKTLEEPPPHVKFVFATTEPERILPTVLSRCQRCDFSSISQQDIVRRLEKICEIEKASPGVGLLKEVASLARGGMRDAQSLLDQILAFAGNQPVLDDLLRITGRVSPQSLNQLMEVLWQGQLPQVIETLNPILDAGTEPSVLTEQLMEALRAELHKGVAAGWTEDQVERQLLAQEILQETRQKLRHQDRGDLVLELALMRIGTLPALIRTGLSSPVKGGTSSMVSTEMKSARVEEVLREPSSRPVSGDSKMKIEEDKVVNKPLQSETASPNEDQPKSTPTTVGRAQGALQALRELPSSAMDSTSSLERAGTLNPPSPSKVKEHATRVSEADDLRARFEKVSSMLSRHYVTDSKLENSDAGWRLVVSQSLEKVLSAPEAKKAVSDWEKVYGKLSIEQGSVKFSSGDSRPAEETYHDENEEPPQVVKQAEEIFSSKARRKKN